MIDNKIKKYYARIIREALKELKKSKVKTNANKKR